MATNPTISIVIPNKNGQHLLQKYLSSVIKASKGAEIIIVDDHSTDDSVAWLAKEFPQVTCIQKSVNEGFAGTVNSGVSKASGEIIILLNTDIEPEEHFIDTLLPHFVDPLVFAVGCMDKSIENKDVVLRGRGIARWEKGFYIHQRGEVNATDTAWVSGGSGAFRKSIWDQLGGLDVIYNPFYWEDIDLSYRALKAGYRIMFESKSIVIHRHQEGAIKKEYSDQVVKRIAYRNQLLFIWKNCSDLKIFLTHLVFLPVRLLQTFLKGDREMMHGFINALQLTPMLVRQRKLQSPLWKKTDREITRL